MTDAHWKGSSVTESAIARLARLTGRDDEHLELAVRKVATPEGARYYGVPIGTPIRAAQAKKALGKPGGFKAKTNGIKGPASKKKAAPGGGIPSAPGKGPRKPKAVPDGKVPNAPDAPNGSAVDRVKETRAPRPLTDAEYQIRAEELGAAILRDFSNGTDRKHSLDGKGKIWEKERTRLHVEIANAIYEEEFAKVPSEGRALFSGGLGGAGKGTLLGSGKVKGVKGVKFGTVNPDDVKEFMAREYPDMVPTAPEYKTKLEASGLIHEESSHIASMIAERAYAERKNIIWDITMSKESSVQSRIDRLRETGYEDVQAVFIDIPVEVSVKRALGRHRRGMEDERRFTEAGIRPKRFDGTDDPDDPIGGRFVPPQVIREQASGDTSLNKLAFDALRDQFDSWELWDNGVDNRDAVLKEEGKGRTPATRQNRARLDAQRRSGTAPKSKSTVKQLEAERAKLAEELAEALLEGYDPDVEGDAESRITRGVDARGKATQTVNETPAVRRIKARLLEIRNELGLSSVDRLREMLQL